MSAEPQVAPEERNHGHERTGLYRRVEGEPEAHLVHAQEVLGEEQVPGAGDGEELREPLNHAQK